MPKREKHELDEIKDIGNGNVICNRKHHISSKNGNNIQGCAFLLIFFNYLIHTMKRAIAMSAKIKHTLLTSKVIYEVVT